MYTLRRISGSGVEMNHALGQSYTLIRKDVSPKVFECDYRELFNSDPNEDETCFALASTEGGDQIFRLFSNQKNYIMVGGKTVDKIEL